MQLQFLGEVVHLPWTPGEQVVVVAAYRVLARRMPSASEEWLLAEAQMALPKQRRRPASPTLLRWMSLQFQGTHADPTQAVERARARPRSPSPNSSQRARASAPATVSSTLSRAGARILSEVLVGILTSPEVKAAARELLQAGLNRFARNHVATTSAIRVSIVGAAPDEVAAITARFGWAADLDFYDLKNRERSAEKAPDFVVLIGPVRASLRRRLVASHACVVACATVEQAHTWLVSLALGNSGANDGLRGPMQ